VFRWGKFDAGAAANAAAAAAFKNGCGRGRPPGRGRPNPSRSDVGICLDHDRRGKFNNAGKDRIQTTARIMKQIAHQDRSLWARLTPAEVAIVTVISILVAVAAVRII
jgi:hypothetical protein